HELGVKITKLHRVISFRQENWLKPYIDFNTKKKEASKERVREGLFQANEQLSFWKDHGEC
ncbi:MAG: hypothetical protein ACKPKO_59395, partial [Candidatus Fonsibacter sp.]